MGDRGRDTPTETPLDSASHRSPVRIPNGLGPTGGRPPPGSHPAPRHPVEGDCARHARTEFRNVPKSVRTRRAAPATTVDAKGRNRNRCTKCGQIKKGHICRSQMDVVQFHNNDVQEHAGESEDSSHPPRWRLDEVFAIYSSVSLTASSIFSLSSSDNLSAIPFSSSSRVS